MQWDMNPMILRSSAPAKDDMRLAKYEREMRTSSCREYSDYLLLPPVTKG
jgi:hypothetical protein